MKKSNFSNHSHNSENFNSKENSLIPKPEKNEILFLDCELDSQQPSIKVMNGYFEIMVSKKKEDHD